VPRRQNTLFADRKARVLYGKGPLRDGKSAIADGNSESISVPHCPFSVPNGGSFVPQGRFSVLRPGAIDVTQPQRGRREACNLTHRITPTMCRNGVAGATDGLPYPTTTAAPTNAGDREEAAGRGDTIADTNGRSSAGKQQVLQGKLFSSRYRQSPSDSTLDEACASPATATTRVAVIHRTVLVRRQTARLRESPACRAHAATRWAL
jgi:hypothetical protein